MSESSDFYVDKFPNVRGDRLGLFLDCLYLLTNRRLVSSVVSRNKGERILSVRKISEALTIRCGGDTQLPSFLAGCNDIGSECRDRLLVQLAFQQFICNNPHLDEVELDAVPVFKWGIGGWFERGDAGMHGSTEISENGAMALREFLRLIASGEISEEDLSEPKMNLDHS